MDELIDFLLGIANDAHKAHLGTHSYAQHMALGSFYEDVRSDGDALFEALIGMGQTPTEEPDPSAMLKDAYRQLQTMRDICDNDPAAQNLFDTVSGHFLSAIYKLDRLK